MITVFGLGFVGLTTALGFSNFGYSVYGIDVDNARMNQLKDNELPFLEPHMAEELSKHNNKNFKLTNDVKKAVTESHFIFYCVGTPYGENGEADLQYLFAALDNTLKEIDRNQEPKILMIKSTIPPSTTKERIIPFIEKNGFVVGKDIFVSNNPEFLREGYCWEDFINADRVVIGCEDEKIVDKISDLYKPFERPIHFVSYNTSEFIKYLSNTFLATLVSYSNEMSLVADAIGDIQISKAFKILHEDKRWGNADMVSYVYPGCGYGGYCLPKDTNALYSISNKYGFNPQILGQVIKLNDNMVERITKRVIDHFSLNHKIGILGLSFKPYSNDVRESVSAKVIRSLKDSGVKKILAYDPVAIQEFDNYYKLDVEFCSSIEEISEKADGLVILTGWHEFLSIREKTNKDILDCRYIL